MAAIIAACVKNNTFLFFICFISFSFVLREEGLELTFYSIAPGRWKSKCSTKKYKMAGNSSAFRCMADPAPQAPTGQTAPDSCRLWQPQGSKVWARLQSQVSLSVQFTRIFYIYAKQTRKQRVQSSHGVRRLWAIPCKDLQLRWGKDGSADNCLSKASSRRAAKIISPNATA